MHISLTDQQLADLNQLLPWRMYFVDADGRRLGGGEVHCVHGWSDQRVATLLKLVPVAGKRVLEPGCLEGVMTCALCAAGAEVTAFDVRPSCVIKTFARCLAFGFQPRLLLHDARRMRSSEFRVQSSELEASTLNSEPGTRNFPFDLVFHSGVFYHLANPVEHMHALASMAPLVFLDTHTAKSGAPLDTVDGYAGMWSAEHGWHDEFSGVEAKSFWLTKPELRRLFDECGFDYEVLHDDDHYEKGPRGWYLLQKRS